MPVSWEGRRAASAPVDPRVADIPHLLARLVARYGPASGATGIRGYILDNEPGLWATQHPRIVRQPVRIADLLARSIKAARAIKAIDPDAWVIGPASWGATGMVSLQNAPDWNAYRHHGSFLAAYLDAFRLASEREGKRLLDALDVHWYPFSERAPCSARRIRPWPGRCWTRRAPSPSRAFARRAGSRRRCPCRTRAASPCRCCRASNG